MKRRAFFERSSLMAAGLLVSSFNKSRAMKPAFNRGYTGAPVIISTWNFGKRANAEAYKVITEGGMSLDAVERGIKIIEADPANHSVGLGGYPDRDGNVTLDACIMDPQGKAGSVAFLEDIRHPISVARKIMENTPHVMLAGRGALQFALENGFERENLLTGESEKAWEEWKEKAEYQPVINIENHDTIGLLCLDGQGRLSGGCSTSGLAYKMHGRVGDSPIIGAALFVDDEIGAAVTTGMGELVMRSLTAFLVVELMRQGAPAQSACEEAIMRIVDRDSEANDMQVGIIALSKAGEVGAFSIHPGFNYAIKTDQKDDIINAPSYFNE